MQEINSNMGYSNTLKDLLSHSTQGLANSMRNAEKKKLLWDETSFLSHDANCVERMWYVKNHQHEQVKCPVCGKDTKIKKDNIVCCSFRCTIQMKDEKTGLSKAQMRSIKSQETMLKIGDDGLNGYERAGKKCSQTLLSLDEETGLSKAQMRSIKSQETMLKIGDDGLNGYERASRKAHANMKTSLIGDITINDQRTINSVRGKLNKQYDIIQSTLPAGYTLLTTKAEYTNILKIKYQHHCGEVRVRDGQSAIRCLKCFPYNKSNGENEVLDYCKTLVDDVISNSRSIIAPKEIDIYIPSHDIAIEYNGLFWHTISDKFGGNKNRHLEKTQLCSSVGIKVFHIFENEWLDPVKQEIWKSIIRNQLGQSDRLYARKCEIKPVDTATKSMFLQENHLQGDCVSSVNFGLYYDSELVSLMTFGQARFNKKYDWELLRFCNTKNLSVVGGASRLLKRFRDDHVGSIISYADMRRSSGNLYKQLGFELSHVSKPNYWYWKPGALSVESRIKYQKHKLSDKLATFDPNLSESDNMFMNGYRKLYDCGNQVWTLL